MSDLSVMQIKQELDTSTTTATTACCSPTFTTIGVNRSNSYSNSTTASSSGPPGNSSISANSCNGANKSSPAASPERQLCSSTTTLEHDLNNVTVSHENNFTKNVTLTVRNTNTGGDGDSSGSGTIRDELRRLCLVCGDVASGFHYGVASCEACKAFFKRTIQGNIEYTCPANNECEINKRRRKACQACRFQKCLLMGMLKEGVRLDRVRGGRQKYRRNPVSNSYQTMQLLYQSNTTSLDDIKILDVLNSYEPDTLSIQQSQNSNSDEAQKSDKYAKNDSKYNWNLTNTCSFKNNNRDGQEILIVLSDLYDKELVGMIGWAKLIPGFLDLSINDQMKLLKVSWAEILTLQLTFRSIPFNGKLCFATDVWMDELIAKESGYSEFYYHCVQIVQRLERLSPRREEYYLLKALMLSNCDILLDDQSSLRSFRDTILNSLNDVVYLLRHSSAVSHQQQLLLLLPSLRQADCILRRFWRKVHHDGLITLKKLFLEMLEITPR